MAARGRQRRPLRLHLHPLRRRIWRCAPIGRTRTRTGSRPGLGRSLCSTVAGQRRGRCTDGCSGSTAGREETGSPGGSARSGCAGRWSRLEEEEEERGRRKHNLFISYLFISSFLLSCMGSSSHPRFTPTDWERNTQGEHTTWWPFRCKARTLTTVPLCGPSLSLIDVY